MLRIDTCKLTHTNSYKINQSYEFVFHFTSSLQPPNKKVRTFGKWCWRRSPNKALLLMLRNDTCELPHTNLYVYHQSYEFVLRNTKNYFPPEPKKLTQHHVWYSKYIVVCTTKILFPTRTKNWHNSTTGKKVPPAHAKCGQFPPAHAKQVYLFLRLSVRPSVCLWVRAKRVE